MTFPFWIHCTLYIMWMQMKMCSTFTYLFSVDFYVIHICLRIESCTFCIYLLPMEKNKNGAQKAPCSTSALSISFCFSLKDKDNCNANISEYILYFD